MATVEEPNPAELPEVEAETEPTSDEAEVENIAGEPDAVDAETEGDVIVQPVRDT